MNADILALLLKVTAIFGSAALAAFVLRRSSAAWRHFVWSAAMNSVMVLVVLQLVVPPIVVRVPDASPFRALAHRETDNTSSVSVLNAARESATIVPQAVGVSDESALGSPSNTQFRIDANERLSAPNILASASASPETSRKQTALEIAANSSTTNASPVSWSAEDLRDVLVFIWAIGSLILLSRIARSHWHLHRLVGSSQPLNDHALHNQVDLICTRLNVSSRVRLLIHPNVNTPCTAGWRNPMVMLPANHAEWSTARTRAVLMHELAHIERRDSLSQTIASIVCALFWFHPVCWVAARLLRQESERAADDVVISAGMSPVEYADHLLAIADRSAYLNHVPVAAVGMARTTQLETRLRAMLNARQSRRTLSRSAQRLVGIGSLLAVVPLAALQARVQDPALRATQPEVPRKSPAPVQAPAGVGSPVVAPPSVPMPAVVPPASGVAPRTAQPLQSVPTVVLPDVAVPLREISKAGPPKNEGPYVNDSTSIRADTVIQAEIAAAPGGELRISLLSGGNVAVHGWDQPTARLRARLTGLYWRETGVWFERTKQGVELFTMAQVEGVRVIEDLPTDTLTNGGKRILIRGQSPGAQIVAIPPVTLDNEFELWVPRHTNIKFASGGGDLALQDIEGTFSGSTRSGTVKANKSRGGANEKFEGNEMPKEPESFVENKKPPFSTQDASDRIHIHAQKAPPVEMRSGADLPRAKAPPVDVPQAKVPKLDAPRAKLPAFNMPQTKPSQMNLPRAKIPPADVTDPVKERKPFGVNGNVKPERMDTVVDKTIGLAGNDDVLTVYSDIPSDVEFHQSTGREVRVRAIIPAAFSEVNVSFDRVRTGPQLSLSSAFARKSGTFHLRYEIWMPKEMQLYVAPNGGPTAYGIDVYGVRGIKNVQQLNIQGWMDIGCISFAITHIASGLRGTLTCGLPTLPLSGFVPLKVTVNGEPQIDRIRSAVLGSQAVVPFVKNYSISSPFLQLKADSAVVSAHTDTLRIEYNKSGGRVDYNRPDRRD